MSEFLLQIIATLKTMWIASGSLFYGLGGTEGFAKWWRRFLFSVWIGTGIWVFGTWTHLFSWWQLYFPVLLCACLHLGYSGNDGKVSTKLRKRFLIASGLSLSAIPLVINSGLWRLLPLHICLCALGSIYCGVVSPFRHAREEETMIAILSTMTVLYLL